jgi:hypothetical protein
LEDAIKQAKYSGEDMSTEYHHQENTYGYSLQEDLRLITRSLLTAY